MAGGSAREPGLTPGGDYPLRPQRDLTAAGPAGRLRDNLAALRQLRDLQIEDRPATRAEQDVLARWSAWGALPWVFDPARQDETTREVRDLLGPDGWRAAARTTINAHYTDTSYAEVMWRTLRQLGFPGGRVLEPGCGAGTFIAAAPSDGSTHVTGIELDPTTAAIAAYLHPTKATIRSESFSDTRLPEGSFDAVIGNVPFGKVVLYDPIHNRARHTLHNFFIVKGLHLLAPGGCMVVLSSRYTLDSRDDTARRAIYDLADLVGAVRLPNGAHARAAGTEVVTDLLVLRRREPGQAPGDDTWLTSRRYPPTTADTAGPADLFDAGEQEETGAVFVNAYFHEHPDLMLGAPSIGDGLYGATDLVVTMTGTFQEDLDTALAGLTQAARAAGLTHTAPAAGGVIPAESLDSVVAHTPAVNRREGHLEVHGSTVVAYTRGAWEPVTVPKTHHAEVVALLGVRDALVQLLTAEAASSTASGDLDALRAALNDRYDSYVHRWGPLNRFTTARTGRVDEHGNDVLRRMSPAAPRLVRADPMSPTVRALEVFDPVTQTAKKAPIFHQRVVAPRHAITSADSPADALAVSLDQCGRVDLEVVAQLLALDPAQARAALGTLVFDDPATGTTVPAAEYLSGNVRLKLRQAQAAVDDNPALAVNVAALEQVQPSDLTPAEIHAAIGAVWIPAEVMQSFLRETLRQNDITVTHAGGSEWIVEGGNRYAVLASSTWGTPRMDAITIARRLMRQQPLLVHDAVLDGNGREVRVVNPTETEAVMEKAAALQERFGEWLWDEPDRAAAMCRRYNDTFNAIVLRTYSTDHMTLPGLTVTFKPHPHQLAAVARMVAEPAVGLFHEVGAGKTAEMVMGVMELRRLGLVRKPAIVVPNHMLEQFTREFLQLYPQAHVLAAGIEDVPAARRREFVGRIATGDWDAVVMTRTAFEALPVSADAERAYEDARMDTLRAQLQRAKDAGASMGVKRMEATLAGAEERLKRMLDRRRDAGVTFEETGIDYLCVDELHDYKNLTIASNIPNVARVGSGRATDLDMKIHTLRARLGDRVITGATATPIANSVAEAYTMQAYLRPDLLREAGITDFDSWAATFGESVTEIELAPEGGGRYRTTTRFARFKNVPELLRLWHVSADVKTAADLGLPVPALQVRPDGQRAPETVVITPSDAQLEYVRALGDRAERVRSRQGDSKTDNMLVITGDGRKAALDMRLVGHDVGDEDSLLPAPTKLDTAAARIHRIWTETRHRRYTDEAGQPSPAAGALQIVFCDLATPGGDAGWNAYDELKAKLVEHGMDPTRIRYIHEAKNTDAKGRLFAACRDGQVDVIIGSTARMGVGTNIQRRAVALHHLDCPWRPADIAQREGRILRQGNQNPDIAIVRYVVEQTFDAYMWQTVERKARFIGQVMKGSLDARDLEDVGDNALSYNEVKALASGDPNILALAQAQQELVKLERLERGYHRAQSHLAHTVAVLRSEQDRLHAAIPLLEDAINTTRTPADFTMTVNGERFTERPAAATALRKAIAPDLLRVHAVHTPMRRIPAVATYAGHTFDATITAAPLGDRNIELTLTGGIPATPVLLTSSDITETSTSHGIVTKLENRIIGLPDTLAATRRRLDRVTDELDTAATQIGTPFTRRDDLTAARQKVAAITERMTPHPTQTHTSPPVPTAPASNVTEGLSAVREALAAARNTRPGGDHHQPGRTPNHAGPTLN